MRKLPPFSMFGLFVALCLSQLALSQTDPGVQTGTRTNSAGVSTGGTLISQGDTTGFLSFFNDGLNRFQDVESVSNNPAGNNGLGPRFNSNQCSSCHAQPAIGGSGAAMKPQFAFAGSSIAPGLMGSSPPIGTTLPLWCMQASME